MPLVGNEVKVRDNAACHEDYNVLKQSGTYFSSQESTFRAPSAQTYVQQLFREAPEARLPIQGKLAVVTGVFNDGVSFHIAQELALRAKMHVILMGRSETNLARCVAAITAEASSRGERESPKPILYQQKFNLASLDSVKHAATYVSQVADKSYQGELHVLVNFASVGTNDAKLTVDGLEYNTGCNFVATHYFTKLLLPVLQAAATSAYKPRVVQTSSLGHALGDRFDPNRLLEHPREGGAPAGYIVVTPQLDEGVATIREFEPMPGDPAYGQPKIAAIAKVGTHVGRSKMAVLADVIHMTKLFPEICFTSQYPGSIATKLSTKESSKLGWWDKLRYHYSLYMFRLSSSQGARAALRAALDPNMNSAEDLQGAYLHADGNPWVPMHPSTLDPVTGQPYTMEMFAQACYEAAESLLTQLNQAPYQPPSIVSTPLQTDGVTQENILGGDALVGAATTADDVQPP